MHENENLLRYSSSKYRPADYSKYAVTNLENSQFRNYNPEFDHSYSKSNSFNTTLKSTHTYQAVSRNPSDTRLKEVLNIMNTPQRTEYINTPQKAEYISTPQKTEYSAIPRDRSIEHLSRDLDDRIAKIKQKYYETTNGPLYDPRKLEGSEYRRWDSSHTEERRVGGYSGEGLARSRATRESLRNSIYTPYNATRALTYQYA